MTNERYFPNDAPLEMVAVAGPAEAQMIEEMLKNNGIELEVRSPQHQHLGDLCIGRGTIEWCAGKTNRGNGIRWRPPD